MRMDLLVMVLALLVSAAAQDLLPGLPGETLKIPFLTGVALYYALNRPLAMALVAAMWAGWLTDGPGGLPCACTSIFLLLLALGLRPLRRFFLDGTFIGVVAATMGAVLLQALWQMAWARLAFHGGAWKIIGDIILLPLSGGVAGAVAYPLVRGLDLLSGNVKSRKDVLHGTA